MAEDKDSTNLATKAIGKAEEAVGLVEKMGCCCLNLGCLLLILCTLCQIAMIVGVITNPLDAIKEILGSLWGIITGTK